MCLIGIAWRAHPKIELAVVANRDEFHGRPAAAAAFWDNAPGVYGGRDLKQGGGWLAVANGGRLAAVTNVRRMMPPDPTAPSRGSLVADFVRGTESAESFSKTLAEHAAGFAGFNLLLFDGTELLYVSNHPDFLAERVEPGVHVVSNASLDTPWPKSLRLSAALRAWLAEGANDAAPLWQALTDERPAADDELPDTGVGLEMERFLSPPFIRGGQYGTRASSLVVIGANGTTTFSERCFGPNGVPDGQSRVQLADRGTPGN